MNPIASSPAQEWPTMSPPVFVVTALAPNPTAADTIMDRIVNGVHWMQLVGESMQPKPKSKADK